MVCQRSYDARSIIIIFMTIYLIRSPFSQVIYFERLWNHYFCHLFTIPFYCCWKCTIFLLVCCYYHSYSSMCSWCSVGFLRFDGENRSFFAWIKFHSKQDNKRSMSQQIVSLVLSLQIVGPLFQFPLMRCFYFPSFSHSEFHSFLFAALSETTTNEHSLRHMNRRLRYTSRTFTYVLIGYISSFI